MSKFQNVIFTPTEKSENDDPVCCLPVVTNFPDAVSKGLYVFRQIEKILNKSGIELVDSKFEFGIDPDTKELCLADEIGTPDSSRFCHSDSINIGCDPEWADKQIARNYAEKYWKDSGLDNKGPISFPPEIIDQLETTYLSLFHGISGIFLRDFCAQYNSSKVF
jgi:phosphoribosylaminoimidazole-succinocarboxamide synthase